MKLENWLHAWLYTGSMLGIPRAGWALVTTLATLDVICAHSKNPRINHLASAISLLVAKTVELLGISKIPGFGPAIMAVLNGLIGPAVVADVETGKPVVTSVVPPEPTKPDAPLPPAA